jgi:hypothetical protein
MAVGLLTLPVRRRPDCDRRGTKLLALDADLDRVADVIGIEMDEA